MEAFIAAITVGPVLLATVVAFHIALGGINRKRALPALPANPQHLRYTLNPKTREWEPALTDELRQEIYQTPEWWDREFAKLNRHAFPDEQPVYPSWPASFPATSHLGLHHESMRALRAAIGAGTGNTPR